MQVKHVSGDIYKATEDIIIHQVDCLTTLKDPLSRALSMIHPEITAKLTAVFDNNKYVSNLLSAIGIHQTKPIIISTYVALTYGTNAERTVSYDAVEVAFLKIKDYCQEKGLKSIAIPYYYGQYPGNGSIIVLHPLIEQIFKNTDINITYYRLKK